MTFFHNSLVGVLFPSAHSNALFRYGELVIAIQTLDIKFNKLLCILEVLKDD